MACIFCKIVAREIPAGVIYQDDRVTAFRDIHPQAPVHILLVPNEHIPSLVNLRAEHDELMGYLIRTASKLAEQEGVATSGFRLILNAGPNAGQTVDHVHLHLLGGRNMD